MATVKEKATGVSFPGSFTPPGMADKSPLASLGCGLREKRVIGLVGVKVYAIAYHGDADAVKAAVSSFSGKDQKSLSKDEAFFTALCDDASETCLTIAFVRDITQEQFVNALKEALDPKVKTKGAPVEIVTSFLECFHGLSFSNGSRIFVTLLADKVFISGLAASDVPKDLVPPADIKVASVESPVLGTCMKMCYFGKDAVAPSLKTSVAEGVAALLK